MTYIKKYLIILFLFTNQFYANGNLNDFEMGTSIYRNLAWSSPSGWHWHTGLFNYFTYDSVLEIGYMNVAEVSGSWWNPTDPLRPRINYSQHSISVSNYVNEISTLKQNFKDMFSDGMAYYGGFEVSIQPSKRLSIVSTSQNIAFDDMGYTSNDMIDANNVWCWDHYWWCEHWNGNRSNIDEIRCDGLVEYSYEKNGVIVCNAYNYNGSRSSSHDNIANAGQDNLDYHNDLHNGNFNWHEMCPRIQSGNDDQHQDDGNAHNSNSETVSNFSPLVSAIPSTWNFSSTQLTNKLQLNFIVGDNASVKAYVLVQVKKTNESNWHVLVDDNSNAWKFKEVDLVGWNGVIQHTYLHVLWKGKYEGGHYSSNDHNFNVKITVIDQGANYSDSDFTFNGNLPPLNVSVSGPSSLNQNQSGQFTSTPSNGVPPYSYSWKYFPICPDGGGIEKAGKGKKNSIQADMCGSWINFGGNNQIVSHSDPYCFYVKSTVTDVANNTATATHYVSVSSNSNLKDDDEVVIETNAPAETKLFENFPNPFNPTTTIKYQLKNDGFVAIKIYDVLGKVVANLVNENKSSGFYSVSFNANSLPSGVYIYSIRTADFVANKKMLLMK